MIAIVDYVAYQTKLTSYFENSNTKIHLQISLDLYPMEARETFKYYEIVCAYLLLFHVIKKCSNIVPKS